MVDQAVGRTRLPPHGGPLRARLRRSPRCSSPSTAAPLAAGRHRHPARGSGPHVADRYEWQLHAVDGLGLDDVEMDQTVTLVVGFAADVARSAHAVRVAERESGTTDAEWWEANAGPLGEFTAHRDYPLAGRVGQAAGETYQAGTDPGRELSFGLERILDGIEAHIATKP